MSANNRRYYVLAILIAFQLALGAAVPISSAAPLDPNEVIGPLCGVYDVYAAAKILDKRVPIETLIVPKYVSTTGGSTAQDLCTASRDIGLFAEAVGNLSENSLRSSPNMMLLHTRSAGSRNYDHWILYLGMSNGKPVIYDPPHAPEAKAVREIAEVWDGTAVVISDSPVAIGLLKRSDFRTFVGVSIVVLTALTLVRVEQKRSKDIGGGGAYTLRRTGLEFGGMLAGSLVVGLLINMYAESGLLADPTGASALVDAYGTSFAEKIDAKGLHDIVTRHDETIIIDARMDADYAWGHVPGALNLPVNCTESELETSLSGVPNMRRIIVYCQSSGCPFADSIASRLIARGYKNLVLFPGGWADWQAANFIQ
jgi:rhodanese-related sulfurtransferase